MTCAECGAEADAIAQNWGTYRADEPDADESEVVFFCPECAEREFGTGASADGRAQHTV